MSFALVLDANIVIRAVLGEQARKYLLEFSGAVDFFTPDICIEEVREHLPIIFKRRNISPEIPLKVFFHIQNLLQVIDSGFYQEREHEAKRRMGSRDIDDWPVMATALLLTVLFGRRIKIFLV
jgi:predicted nucleic acid-binding protein